MRRVVLRVLAAYLALVGLVAVLFPIAALVAFPVGSALWLDTGALMGRGTQDPRHVVRAVDCTAEAFGSNLRNGPMRLWTCQLVLGDAPSPAASAPGEPRDDVRTAGLGAAQAHAAYRQNLGPLATPGVKAAYGPGSIERLLPFDRSGELPALWRMPAADDDGAVPRYAVVWGSRELLSRWFVWAGLSLLVGAFGAGALYAARVAWNRR